MPKDKTETHQKILPAAKQEFLEKGFEQASMRSIASKIGMSAAGLYRHFEDKEAMFAALVEPVLKETNAWYQEHKMKDYEWLEMNELDAMWESDSELHMMEDLIYKHFDEFKLLICCSEGTRYSTFLHDTVVIEQEETELYMEAARKKGIPVKDVDSDELHLLLSAYVTAIFEVVIHDFPRDAAEHYMKTLQEFFAPGWRAVLGL